MTLGSDTDGTPDVKLKHSNVELSESNAHVYVNEYLSINLNSLNIEFKYYIQSDISPRVEHRTTYRNPQPSDRAF